MGMEMSGQITRADIDAALMKHTNEEMPRIKEMVEQAISGATQQLLHAFPDGIERHRASHEQMIAASKAEEAFWKDLKIDIAKKSIWGILHILILLTLGTLAIKLGVGPIFGIGK